MDFSIFNKRERYKREIQALEKIYADWDIKLKSRKIYGCSRQTYPELELEGESIEKFKEIFEKVKYAGIGKNVTEIGYAFVFPVQKEYVKKVSETDEYTLAIISPFPDNIRYKEIMLNKKINVKPGDYICLKKGFVKANITKEGHVQKVLYVDEIAPVDKVKAYKISQNLLNDFMDKIQAMLPEEAEKTEGDKIAASVLSASHGIGLFSIVSDENAKAGISKIYNALQNSLPEIFRNEKISLKFTSPYIKKNSVKIILEGVPLFQTLDFGEHPQQSMWFENAFSNQTISSPLISGRIYDGLFLYRNANIVHNFEKFSDRAEYRGSKIKEEPIYDEEIQFWLISQRNLCAQSFNNDYVAQFFKKIFANTVQENLDLSLPENILNLAVENTVVKESLHRGFECLCRKGETDSTENAERFIRKNLKEMSEFSMTKGEKMREELAKKMKRKRTTGRKIYDLTGLVMQISGRLPYNDLAEEIKKCLKCDESLVKNKINFMVYGNRNSRNPSPPTQIKIRFINGIKMVEFK